MCPPAYLVVRALVAGQQAPGSNPNPNVCRESDSSLNRGPVLFNPCVQKMTVLLIINQPYLNLHTSMCDNFCSHHRQKHSHTFFLLLM